MAVKRNLEVRIGFPDTHDTAVTNMRERRADSRRTSHTVRSSETTAETDRDRRSQRQRRRGAAPNETGGSLHTKPCIRHRRCKKRLIHARTDSFRLVSITLTAAAETLGSQRSALAVIPILPPRRCRKQPNRSDGLSPFSPPLRFPCPSEHAAQVRAEAVSNVRGGQSTDGCTTGP